MGDDMAHPLLIIDTETRAHPDAATWIVPGKPPANYKSAEAIAKWQAEDVVEQLAKAALDPHLCELSAVGVKVPGEAAQCWLVGHDDTEEHIIRQIATYITHETILIGFNIAFDIMVLRTRALDVGVRFPALSVEKYRSPHIDLQKILTFDGQLKLRSLNWYCKRYSLDVPADPLTGADMLTATPEQIRLHNLTDLQKTEALAIRIGAIRQPEVF